MVVSFVADVFRQLEIKDLRVDEVVFSEDLWEDFLEVGSSALGKNWDKKYLWGAKVIINTEVSGSITVKNIANDVVIAKNRHQI